MPRPSPPRRGPGSSAAEAGAIVTFGIKPSHPATGYGYIRPGASMDGRVRMVGAFVEKPEMRRKAETFVAEGYLWNSGNFLFRGDVFLGELRNFEPEIAAATAAAAGKVRGRPCGIDHLRAHRPRGPLPPRRQSRSTMP